jgi:hypothetical protein
MESVSGLIQGGVDFHPTDKDLFPDRRMPLGYYGVEDLATGKTL